MRVLLLSVLLVALAGCASTSTQDMQSMSTVDVCYLGLRDQSKRPVAEAEVRRRKEKCADHVDELIQRANYEQRARGLGALSLPETNYPTPSAPMAALTPTRAPLTGTRLSTPDGDVGSSSVGGISKDDYTHNRDARMDFLPGETPAGRK